jgi:hypothetical protein
MAFYRKRIFDVILSPTGAGTVRFILPVCWRCVKIRITQKRKKYNNGDDILEEHRDDGR